MKDARRLPLALGLLAATAGLCAAVTASSAPPDTAAPAGTTAPPSTSASADPSASASGSGTGTTTVALTGRAAWPKLRGTDIPAEPSDPPKGKEWDSGKKVRPNRDVDLYGSCEFTLLREWLRAECDRLGATLFAGEPADVKIIPSGIPLFLPDSEELQSKVTVTMRLKRGETKMFQLIAVWGGGYGGIGMGDGDTFSVVWREGREDPLILFGHI